MRIVDIRETVVPIKSQIRNAFIDFSQMTVSVLALVTDVVRDGKPVIGFGFNSNGRYAPSGLLRDRFIPRLKAADSQALLNDAGDNLDPARVWDVLMRNEKPGGHGERSVAVGVMDMAVWDAVAKIAGVPLYRLLADRFRGGVADARVFVYAAGGYYYPGKDLTALQNEMSGYLALGYSVVKMKIGGAPLADDLRRIEAVLKIVKTPDQLAVDANGRFDLKTAIAYAQALTPYGLRWYEEAGDPLDYDLQAKLAPYYAGAMATGENLFSVQDARNLIRYAGLRPDRDVLQFDCALSYGLVEYLRILDMLKEHGWSPARCIPHGGHQMSLNIAAGLGLGGNESYPGIFQPFGGFADGIPVEGSYVRLPEIPGIGFEAKSELFRIMKALTGADRIKMSHAKEHSHRENDHMMVTRRRLIKLGGLSTVLAALPPGLAKASSFLHPEEPPQGVSPLMQQLSTYMSAASSRALPDEVIEKAKQHILDTFAAMISGSTLPPGRGALEFARAYGGKEIATVVASNIVCGPIEAAFANGVLAHSDETDDSHGPSRSHPGVSVVPAAFAAGEQYAITGAHFLRAVTLGYDIGPRITMSMGGPGYQAATHRSTHGTVAAFGAGAAAGCAAGLSAEKMRLLLDYTAQQTSGIGAWSRDAEHMEKAFLFGGKPAAGAVLAATLIQSGWSGVPDVFSGPDNFFEALAPRENGAIKADPTVLVDKLGERYEIARTNIKKWTVGSPIQAPLDALAGFFKKRSFSADDVSKVVVRIASDEANTVSNRDMPDICMQHMVAIMLLDKTVTFSSVHDKARMKDPAVLRQRAKVDVLADPRIDARRPRREAIVELTLADGTQLTEWVRDVRGTADNPMTRDEVVDKARDLIAPVLGVSTTSSLITKLLALETLRDVRELRPALQRS